MQITETEVSQTLKPYGVTLQKRNGTVAQYRVFLTGKLGSAYYTDNLIDALETGLELRYKKQ